MSVPIEEEHSPNRRSFPSGDELASRVFTISIIGVFAAILLMIILGDWW